MEINGSKSNVGTKAQLLGTLSKRVGVGFVSNSSRMIELYTEVPLPPDVVGALGTTQ